MSSARRRGGMEMNSKLHMDRQAPITRITDPSLPAGKRREIDNVMKKARANTNDYWDKKLLEAEEKDPNRWRHTGYKKMYIQGQQSSSGESDHETGGLRRPGRGSSVDSRASYRGGGGGGGGGMRYGRSRSPRSRSHSRLRKSPLSPQVRRRSPPPPSMSSSRDMMDRMSRSNRGSPPPPPMEVRRNGPRPRSPPNGRGGGMPSDMGSRRPMGVRAPRSPPEPPMRRKGSRSPIDRRRGSPPMSSSRRRSPPAALVSGGGVPPSKQRAPILPRSKRPPSPPPRSNCRSRSNSSVSSCSDDSCSVCSPNHRHRSRSVSMPRSRGPRSPPPKSSSRSMHQYHRGGGGNNAVPIIPASSTTGPSSSSSTSRMHAAVRPISPPMRNAEPVVNKYHRSEMKVRREQRASPPEGHVKVTRPSRHSPPEDPRLKNRPPEPPVATVSSSTSTVAVPPPKKKKKSKELRTRVKIEGEKRKKHSSSESDDSGASDSDEALLPTFTATTRLTLSERFGKMAQWSIDRSNMENMRITKDSDGGALKVMLDSPPRRYSYSPAPAGHFPEELATTAPSGMLSWDDVRVRYEYYKSRGYLRDLDLKDYIKWEEWWYKYQEWLKQERYYEYWERQQLARRRRKKLPITQRLN